MTTTASEEIYFGLDRGRLTDPTAELQDLLLGKSIASVDQDASSLTLSDGTVLTIVPNFAQGYEGEGDFFLDRISSVEGVIVALEAHFYYDPSRKATSQTEVYRISVQVADSPTLEELISVSGDSGEGDNGSGFTIEISH